MAELTGPSDGAASAVSEIDPHGRNALEPDVAAKPRYTVTPVRTATTLAFLICVVAQACCHLLAAILYVALAIPTGIQLSRALAYAGVNVLLAAAATALAFVSFPQMYVRLKSAAAGSTSMPSGSHANTAASRSHFALQTHRAACVLAVLSAWLLSVTQAESCLNEDTGTTFGQCGGVQDVAASAVMLVGICVLAAIVVLLYASKMLDAVLASAAIVLGGLVSYTVLWSTVPENGTGLSASSAVGRGSTAISQIVLVYPLMLGAWGVILAERMKFESADEALTKSYTMHAEHKARAVKERAVLAAKLAADVVIATDARLRIVLAPIRNAMHAIANTVEEVAAQAQKHGVPAGGGLLLPSTSQDDVRELVRITRELSTVLDSTYSAAFTSTRRQRPSTAGPSSTSAEDEEADIVRAETLRVNTPMATGVYAQPVAPSGEGIATAGGPEAEEHAEWTTRMAEGTPLAIGTPAAMDEGRRLSRYSSGAVLQAAHDGSVVQFPRTLTAGPSSASPDRDTQAQFTARSGREPSSGSVGPRDHAAIAMRMTSPTVFRARAAREPFSPSAAMRPPRPPSAAPGAHAEVAPAEHEHAPGDLEQGPTAEAVLPHVSPVVFAPEAAVQADHGMQIQEVAATPAAQSKAPSTASTREPSSEELSEGGAISEPRSTPGSEGTSISSSEQTVTPGVFAATMARTGAAPPPPPSPPSRLHPGVLRARERSTGGRSYASAPVIPSYAPQRAQSAAPGIVQRAGAPGTSPNIAALPHPPAIRTAPSAAHLSSTMTGSESTPPASVFSEPMSQFEDQRVDSDFLYDYGFEHQYKRRATTGRGGALAGASRRAVPTPSTTFSSGGFSSRMTPAAAASPAPAAPAAVMDTTQSLSETLSAAGIRLAPTRVAGTLTDASMVILGAATPTTTPPAAQPPIPKRVPSDSNVPVPSPEAPAPSALVAAAPAIPAGLPLHPPANISIPAPRSSSAQTSTALSSRSMLGPVSPASEEGAVAAETGAQLAPASPAASLASMTPSAGRMDSVSSDDGEPSFRFGLHVLVVDDEAINRRIAARMLERLGCTYYCIEDGDEIIPALVDSERPYDVILLDILMRRTNGLEVCRNLRAQRIDIPIIAATGAYASRESALYRAAGFDRVLTKPFNQRDLAAALTQALGIQLGRGAAMNFSVIYKS